MMEDWYYVRKNQKIGNCFVQTESSLFYLQFKAMTSCPVAIKDIDLIPLTDLKAYKQEIAQAKDLDATDVPKLHLTRVFDFFTGFHGYLHEIYMDLSIVVHCPMSSAQTLLSLPATLTPAYKSEGTRYYMLYQQEIEQGAPIDVFDTTEKPTKHSYYEHDNTAVWKLLHAIVCDTTNAI